MAKRMQRGQGFSLYGLQPEISQAVDLLTDALNKQGVEVNPDSLLLQIQNVVKMVGEGGIPSSSYSYMQASEEVPYSVAGDLLAVGYEYYQMGNKKEGIKNIISAMSYDDFGDITAGLLAMNAKSVLASDEDTDESEDDNSDAGEEVEDDDSETDDEDEDNSDESDDEDDEDLSDDDIDSLLEDDAQTVESSDEDNEPDVVDDEEEPEGSKPEGKKPMAEEKDDNKAQPITASASHRAIANKLSMSGDKVSKEKASEFLKTVTTKKRAA